MALNFKPTKTLKSSVSSSTCLMFKNFHNVKHSIRSWKNIQKIKTHNKRQWFTIRSISVIWLLKCFDLKTKKRWHYNFIEHSFKMVDFFNKKSNERAIKCLTIENLVSIFIRQTKSKILNHYNSESEKLKLTEQLVIIVLIAWKV